MKTTLYKLTRRLGAALVLSLAAAQSHAIPLSDLLNGGSIEIGDKLFDGFTLLGDPVDPFLSAPIDLSAIEVSGIGDGTAGNEYGLSFSFDSIFSIGSDDPDDFDFMDLFFGYQVTVTDPGQMINGVSLTADAAGEGADAFVTIVKELTDLNGSDLLGAPMEAYSDTVSGESLSASANIAPISSLFVSDNIALFFDALDGASQATLTSFEQRFSQIRVEVPVPATLLLVLLGLCGLRTVRSRA